MFLPNIQPQELRSLRYGHRKTRVYRVAGLCLRVLVRKSIVTRLLLGCGRNLVSQSYVPLFHICCPLIGPLGLL